MLYHHRHLSRLQTIDRLIRIKGTGPPAQLARRLNISESCLYKDISFLKQLGAPINYCKKRCSYYYLTDGGFNFSFQCRTTHLETSERTRGGG